MAGQAPNQLSLNVAEVDRVIGALASGRPRRCLLFNNPNHLLPIVYVARTSGVVENYAAEVRHNVVNTKIFFAGVTELRPISCHWRVEIDFTSIGENVNAKSEHALRDRINRTQCVSLPLRGSRRVSPPSPEIHNVLSFVVQAQRCSNFSTFKKICPEGIENSLIAFSTPTANWNARCFVDRIFLLVRRHFLLQE